MNTEICENDGSSGDKSKEETKPECADAGENEASASESDEKESGGSNAAVDYGEIERQDLEELRIAFPHLKDVKSITELSNPLRYAALRDLGLTPKEAYLATNEPIHRYDTRSHLRSSVPRGASTPSGVLPAHELEAARELFSDLSDREIQKLYKKVSK